MADLPDTIAERSARVLSHLEGALDAPMLDAMADVWSLLERAAVDGDAHARAVRARMLWQSIGSSEHPGVVPLVGPTAFEDPFPYADAA